MSTFGKTRRMFSAVLALIMVLGAFVFLPDVTQTKASASEGYSDWSGISEYLLGKGTEKSPFLISTPQDLRYFRKMVATSDGVITYYENNDTTTTASTRDACDAFYKLTCNIYYNNTDNWENWSTTVTPVNGNGDYHEWISPGQNNSSNREFCGTFDGDGHTIYGMYFYHADTDCVGFFGTAKQADIKNLTLAEGFAGGDELVGAFVGRVKLGVDVINCVNKLNVSGNTAVGGIVGGNAANSSSVGVANDIDTEADASTFSVFNCVNYGKVNGAKWVGGVVGYVSAGSSRAKIEKCVNYGAVSSEGVGAGGVLGGTYTVDNYGQNVVESCENHANISGGATGTTGYVGGVVGCARATDIYNCVNTGDVRNLGTSNYTGGITGGNKTNNTLTNGRIYNCFNSGDVYGAAFVGGIAAAARSVDIHSCANLGNITGTERVGGISGQHGNDSDVRNTQLFDCYNFGAVSSTTGAASVAGIVGEAHFDGTLSSNVHVDVKRCINLGEVSTGRSICYTESTVKNSAGTGVYMYTQNASTCFGLSGVNSNFDGGTAVTDLCSSSVLSVLNAAQPGTWRSGYPAPTLNAIDYSLQNYKGRANVVSFDSATVKSASSLSVNLGLNAGSEYYSILQKMGATYGVLAVKKDALGEEPLVAETAGAVKCEAVSKYGYLYATLSGQTADEYDDIFVFRPYASFNYGGTSVYVYGESGESSYYTAKGANEVPAVRESAAFACDEKLYLLVGGTGEIGYSVSSADPDAVVSFSSNNTAVATVSGNRVYGVGVGTATVSATLTGQWGTKTISCNVTVLQDLSAEVFANSYAEQDGVLRVHTNEITPSGTNAPKNDAHALDFNGTVFIVDSGHNNSKSLDYLLELRAEYLADGLAAGRLSEAEYYRHLLSDKCRIEIIALITHWHGDHLHGLRYHIAKSPRVSIKKLYTVQEPSGTSASGYSTYLLAFDRMMTALATYNPSLTPTRFAYETKKVRYFTGYNTLSTSDTSYPLTLTMCTPYDWSTYSGMNGSSTAWQNCSSMWYVFEYAGRKLLFTGDTFPNSGSSTYTSNLTSGSTAVDYMLSKNKDVIDTGVDFLECNHHGRASFVKNLFTETTPSIIFAGIPCGYESVKLIKTAVKMGDVYLGGDQAHVFTVDASGVLSAVDASPAYSKNADGCAIRNRFTLESNGRFIPVEHEVEKAQNLVSLNANGYYKNSGSYLYRVHPNTSAAQFAAEFAGDVVIKKNGVALNASEGVTTGCVVYSADGTKSVTVSVFGDADGDGAITASDCLATKAHIRRTASLDGVEALSADINDDGRISSLDYIMQKLMVKE